MLQPLAFIATAIAALLAVLGVALIRDIFRLRDKLAGVSAERQVLADQLDQIGQMSARAEAASESKSRFLATVSHEIRTPLNGVLGMADLMLDTPLSPEQQNYARAIKTSGEALLSLIEEILDFSRIEAGKLDINIHEVELGGLVEGVVELLAPRAQGKGLEIATFIAPDIPTFIDADGARLRQILMNLAGNAVKFTQAGGVGIHIARRDADTLALRIEDTGPGIAPDRLEAIFDEFEQGDGATAARHGGTGLGLAISRRLARLMGGDISVTSRPGEGSVFELILPLGASAKVPAEAAEGGAEMRRVLIVAAGPFEGRYLGEYLGAHHGSAELVADAEAALATIAQNAPQLLLMDAAFGQEMCRKVVAAAQQAGCKRHIVMLSPYERRSFGAPAAAGFERYLVKPVRRRSLMVQLREWHGDSAPAVEIQPLETLGGEPLAGRRVLIAEDNDINALLAGRLIERLGGRSVRASTGVEALDLLAATLQPGAPAFDCVLFDVRMPELDGLEALRRWRTMEQGAGRAALPAIALTANAYREDREACFAAGFDGFLAKPLERDSFITTLDSLLGQSRRVA
ncbi:MAG: response regulator [Proteobacteria bacterium]|nr:response regulator [Pseudomonadota bacterium]